MAGRIESLRVKGVRSLRDIHLPLDHVAVYRGANGTGKTNIYRALEFCQRAAAGDLSLWLARQGGLSSAMWAGGARKHEKARIEISATVGDLRYHIEVGHPRPTDAAFPGEPLIKEETVEHLSGKRIYPLMKRRGPSVEFEGSDGKKHHLDDFLLPSETALSRIATSDAAPEVVELRETMLQWRFFHAFRTDPQSPLRFPFPAVTATRLDPDGGNIAAVLATLEHIRQDTADIRRIVSEAFDGASLVIPIPEGQASFSVVWQDLPFRQFTQQELSDGTLQFVALCAALLSYHLPRLVVLNEPENSLHPSLMPALARLVGIAAENSQVIIVTHSQELATALEEQLAVQVRSVEKQEGETQLAGLTLLGTFKDTD
ncbi:MAG: AAA family ATPase [Nitratireductor sp.]|nr:AAA family ATPase [Nitratireductor sp.]MCC0022121.1 AAA family ATPase [Nitratireductor sp.]